MKWLIAAGALILAIALASFASAQARKLLSRPALPENRHQLAAPAGQFVFSILIAAGLVAALGIGDRESLKPLPHDLIAFLPKLLVAGLMVLAGNTAGSLLGSAVAQAAMRATGRPQPTIAKGVRMALVGASAILAVNQLGIDTKIIDLVLSGLVFSIAAAVALLTGLGGRQMATELAAGRYVRHIVRAGDTVAFIDTEGPVKGTVVHVRAATVELAAEGPGVHIHVPHARLLAATLTITRAPVT